MKVESLVWSRRYLSIFMLHFSSQELYIWRNLGGNDCPRFSGDSGYCRNAYTLSQSLFLYIKDLSAYIVSYSYSV
jgi:hypothetical protein